MRKEILIHVLAGLAGAAVMASALWVGLDMHLPVKAASCKLPASYESLVSLDISEIRDLHAAARATYEDATFEDEDTTFAGESCTISQEELDLFAALVYAEAADQCSYRGFQLVADVILNRVDSPLFPDMITDVILQPYQFSPVLDGGLQRGYATVTQECYDACLQEIRGPRVDYNIMYFSMGYCANGEFAYVDGTHYFAY